uniref:Uncharacterized protein n=1 Tax=Aegilops tauschii subsp. strangulata TaxID=200361 RepID=A0A453I1H8_AEGTS
MGYLYRNLPNRPTPFEQIVEGLKMHKCFFGRRTMSSVLFVGPVRLVGVKIRENCHFS